MARKSVLKQAATASTKKRKKKAKRKAKAAKKKAAAPRLGELETRRVPVSKIKPAAYNPRKDLKPGDPEYEKLKRSLEQFGYVDPLIWNERTGNLVGGHQRLKVLRAEYDLAEISVAVVNLPLEQEKTLNVALNKVGGDWDNDALVALLSELERLEGVDATQTGFTQQEIDLQIKQLETEQGGAVDTTQVPRTFEVVISCVDEAAQKRLFERFAKEGLECRVLTF